LKIVRTYSWTITKTFWNSSYVYSNSNREVLPNQLYSNSNPIPIPVGEVRSLGWGAPSAGDGGSATVFKDNESGLMEWRRRRTTEMNIMQRCWFFIMSVTSVHRTHERISVYPVIILSYLYPFSNPIMSLSYHVHQTGPERHHISWTMFSLSTV